MIIILWFIAIYLLIGTCFYIGAIAVMEEKMPTYKFSPQNNTMLLLIVVLWLPMMILSIFGENLLK